MPTIRCAAIRSRRTSSTRSASQRAGPPGVERRDPPVSEMSTEAAGGLERSPTGSTSAVQAHAAQPKSLRGAGGSGHTLAPDTALRPQPARTRGRPPAVSPFTILLAPDVTDPADVLGFARVAAAVLARMTPASALGVAQECTGTRRTRGARGPAHPSSGPAASKSGRPAASPRRAAPQPALARRQSAPFRRPRRPTPSPLT
jgi:hypothetical protein